MTTTAAVSVALPEVKLFDRWGFDGLESISSDHTGLLHKEDSSKNLSKKEHLAVQKGTTHQPWKQHNQTNP
ncbi:unnamed protein product [Musa hybrid cultivar]